MKTSSLAFTYSFPFWLFIDSRSPPEITTVKCSHSRVRAYPPFRSASNDWLPMPIISPDKIPFLRKAKPETFPESDPMISKTFNLMPLLKVDWTEDEGASCVYYLSSEEPQKPKTSHIGIPMDSLRLDKLPGKFGKTSKTQEFTKLLMRHLRVESGQWWITRSTDAIQGWTRHCIPIDEHGAPIGLSSPHLTLRTASGFEVPIDNHIWQMSLKHASLGNEPFLYRELYLDAWYFSATHDFRRMILDAASACEQLKDIVVEKLWSKKNKGRYKRGRVLTGYDITEHIDIPIKSLCGRSFKDEDSVNHGIIANVWDARGNVAHLGTAFYRENGQHVFVNEENALILLSAVDACLNWLEERLREL